MIKSELYILPFIITIYFLYISYRNLISAIKLKLSISKTLFIDTAIITAIFGNSREKQLKKVVPQVRKVDFICFTNRRNLRYQSPWRIDCTPYYKKYKPPFDNGKMVNSIPNNTNPYNVYKYFKFQFYRFPCMKKYKYIIWIDSSFLITSPLFSFFHVSCLSLGDSPVALYEHKDRNGLFENEVAQSAKDYRWKKTFLFGSKQPFQDVIKQMDCYHAEGFYGDYWKQFKKGPYYGVWTTGIISWNMSHPKIYKLLDMNYLQILNYTTQCQVGFPYSCWKLGVKPISILQNDVYQNAFVSYAGHGK